MRRLLRWVDAHGLKVLAFATLAASVASVWLVWWIWNGFEARAGSLARAGSESAEYMGIATMILGSWILPALVGVSVLALLTFAASLRSRRLVGS